MGALAPGFRFCPTDEELLIHYLRPKAWGKAFHQGTIGEVDIYKFEPWDLPDKAALSTKDPEWYFFSTQDKKYSQTARINRTTTRGYWKATGKDRKVFSGHCIVGLKKTLIYYEGRAPNGRRTNWIMHEYRLDQESEKKEKGMSVSVLCRIRKKGGPGPRNGEQYGAPVWNEDGESDDELKPGKVIVSNDATSLDGVNGRGGNPYDLQNQVEGLRSPRRLGSVKVELSEIDSDVNSSRTTEALNWPLNRHGTVNGFATDGSMALSISDLKSNFDNPCTDIAPNMWEDAFSLHHPYMDFQDMGSLFDLESLPGLPTLSDVDGHNLHDYGIPAFDEPEILGEMWSLVSDNHCGLISKGVDNEMMAQQFDRKISPENMRQAVGGNFIEIDDIEAPLGGFALRPPVLDGTFAENRLATMGAVQDSMVQGSATQRVRLQVPASEGRVKNVVTSEHPVATQVLQPQVKTHIHGGSEDISIPLTRESHKNVHAGVKNTKSQLPDSHYGLNFKPCNTPHAVESSTRSYLSKHMSTYAVSTCEIAPPQLCYASLTDNQDGCVEAIKKTNSSVALSIKDENQIYFEDFEIVPVELCYAPSIDIQDGSAKVDKKCDSSTALLTKDEKQIDVDALGKTPVCSLDATASTSLLTKHVIFEGNQPDSVALPAFKVCNFCESCSAGSSHNSENASIQGCDSDFKSINMSSRRHRLRTSLRGLKNKLKQSALGAKFIQLEEGMRTKFNERHVAHGKPSAQLFPTEDDTNAFDRLKTGVLAILYYVATTALILSCLFWGFHIMTKYASYVSVSTVI